MDSFSAAELEWILWIQELTGAAVRAVMVAVTALGSEEVLFLLVVICFFTGKPALGLRLGTLLAISGVLNAELKALFGRPRPSDVMPQLRQVFTRGLSFPSGHAQNSAAVWGYLGNRLGGWRLSAACALVALIGLSRVVLGVHYPSDVVAGWLAGGLLALGFARLARRLPDSGGGRFSPWGLAAGSMAALLLCVWSREPHAARLIGVASGLWAASVRTPASSAVRPAWTAAAAAALVLLLFGALKWLLVPRLDPAVASVPAFAAYFGLGYLLVSASRSSARV